ncbi:cytochrome P450 [Paraphoma chrysanthemicola]|nr:cytochrome P450 [Paraphoma chrysanthemicola]
MTSSMINSTSFPDQYAYASTHQISFVVSSEQIMFQDLFVSTWFLVLGSCVAFPFVTRFRSYITQCLNACEWLFCGPQLLAKRYVPGIPFSIKTPYREYHLVSSREHIHEISRADEDQLSLVEIAEEVFQPHHTMNGIELNRLGMQRRILRKLSLKLEGYQQPLTNLIATEMRDALSGRTGTTGAWTGIGIFSMTQKVVAMANTFTFYGHHFTGDQAFLEAALQYPRDVFIAAEVLRCVPSALSGPASWLATRGHRASNHMFAKLVPMVEERLRCGKEVSRNTQQDYVQYVIDLYPEDVPDRARRIVEQTLALWFASVHQPAITLYYAILDLCEHPHLQQQLLAEISASQSSDGSIDPLKLELLDSFLKESARLNTSESISLRRKAVQPFTFKDGTHVAAEDWVCVPQRPLLRDAAIYPNPDTFDPFRFMSHNTGTQKASKFTDLSPDYPMWGLGKQACPGRFYASLIVKLVLIELIQSYDFRMETIPDKRYFTWRSSLIPRPNLQFQVRARRFDR